MRVAIILAAMVFAITAASVSAQGRGNGQAKRTTVSAPKAKPTQAAKQTARQTKQTARQTKKADTRVAKADARAAKTTAKADARVAKADTRTAKRTTKTATGSTTTTTTDAPLTKAEARAARLNPNQEARLLAQLPAGMTVQDAAKGFKNWGQFQAAVNTSTNHGVSFVELKAMMTGIPVGGTEPTMAPMSLGQAKKSLGIVETTPAP